MLLRHAFQTLLLASALLAACGDDSVDPNDLQFAQDEPPTPPPIEGADANHLLASFPQEPINPGEVWVRPGSVSNIIKKQQPESPEAATPQAVESTTPVPAAIEPAADGPTAANDQLVAEYTPPTAAPKPTPAAPPKVPAPAATGAAAAPATSSSTPASPSPAAKPTAPAAKPKPTSAAPAVEKTNNLSVGPAALATKIENRKPIGVSDTFADGTRIYLFSTILNPDGHATHVRHKWYRGEEVIASIKLSVKSPHWRTWSVVPAFGKGSWRVEVLAPNGKVIHTEKFTVN